MSIQDRIQLLEKLRRQEPISICLEVLEIPSSSYYYSLAHPKEALPKKKRYQGLRKKIERIILQHPSYGYRRIQADLYRKEKIRINHKPLKKLLKLWHLKHIRRVKSPKPSPLASEIKALGAKVNLVARLDPSKIKIFQVIFVDFTELTSQAGILYLILFTDQKSRRIVGWNIEAQDDTANALKGYTRARRYLKRMKVDLNHTIIHQDQDSVFTGYEYAGTLLNDGISLSFTEKGFKDNPAIESCIGHFKDDYRDQIQETKTLSEAKKILDRCVQDWNKERLHSSLNNQTPDEFIHTFYKFKKS